MYDQHANPGLCDAASSLLGNLNPELVLIEQVAKISEVQRLDVATVWKQSRFEA
jgi:hypothetical protein